MLLFLYLNNVVQLLLFSQFEAMASSSPPSSGSPSSQSLSPPLSPPLFGAQEYKLKSMFEVPHCYHVSRFIHTPQGPLMRYFIMALSHFYCRCCGLY